MAEKIRKIYVWQTPVKICHWVNALCVITLCITGYLIGDPPAIQDSSEASFGYWFGTIRFVHFVTAFLFFFSFAVRIYWGFAGNKYAKWYHFIPYKKSQWKEIWGVIKVDILHITNKPILTIGHNALASFIYFLVFLVFLMQCLTGFGMYAAMSESWFPQLFEWIVPILGGDWVTRQMHHLLMWAFILFAMVHVYLVFYHDYVERQGVTSSMINGWKYIEEEEKKEEKTKETDSEKEGEKEKI